MKRFLIIAALFVLFLCTIVTISQYAYWQHKGETEVTSVSKRVEEALAHLKEGEKHQDVVDSFLRDRTMGMVNLLSTFQYRISKRVLSSNLARALSIDVARNLGRAPQGHFIILNSKGKVLAHPLEREEGKLWGKGNVSLSLKQRAFFNRSNGNIGYFRYFPPWNWWVGFEIPTGKVAPPPEKGSFLKWYMKSISTDFFRNWSGQVAVKEASGKVIYPEGNFSLPNEFLSLEKGKMDSVKVNNETFLLLRGGNAKYSWFIYYPTRIAVTKSLKSSLTIEGLLVFSLFLFALITYSKLHGSFSSSLKELEANMEDASLAESFSKFPTISAEGKREFSGIVNAYNTLVKQAQEYQERLSESGMRARRFRNFIEAINRERKVERIYRILIKVLEDMFDIIALMVLHISYEGGLKAVANHPHSKYLNKEVFREPGQCPVISSGMPYYYANPKEDIPCLYMGGEEEPQYCLCLPLITGGRVAGVIKMVLGRSLEPWESEEIRKYVDALSPVVNAINLLEQAEKQAITDHLTGLYNRRVLFTFLEKQMALARREGTQLSILMMDIDEFRQFNERYGHQIGDRVLENVSKLLRVTMREGDLVARYGGDEFCAVLPKTDLDLAMQVARRTRDRIASVPIELSSGNMAFVSLSIGISTYPQHGNDTDTLLRMADAALYEAKKSGRGKVAFPAVNPRLPFISE